MPMETDEEKKGTQVRRVKGLFLAWLVGDISISQKIHGVSDDIAILKLYELAYPFRRRMASVFSQHDAEWTSQH